MSNSQHWRKASASNPSGCCVELSRRPASDGGKEGYVIAMRNSRDPHGPVLEYTQDEIAAFLDGVKKGEFDDFALPLMVLAKTWEPADDLERRITGGWASGSCLPED